MIKKLGKMAQPTKPGNAERGWNDPPMFLHTPGVGAPPTGASPGKRTPLNKRVAHPGLYGGASGPGTAQPMNTDANQAGGGPPTNPAAPPTVPPPLQPAPAGPPLVPPPASDTQPRLILMPPANTIDVPKYTAPIIVPTMSPTEKDCPVLCSPVATNPVTNQPVSAETAAAGDDDVIIPNFDDDQQLFHYVVTRLLKALTDCKPVLQARDAEDCQKRLDLLSTMWEKGQLSYPVKSSLAKLATALHRRKCDLADSIHLALMFDHVAEVSQWMVGVKRLIREARNIEAPVSPTDNTAEEIAQAESNNQQTHDSPQMENSVNNEQLVSNTPAVLDVATEQVVLNSSEGAKVVEGVINDTEDTAASSDSTCDKTDP